MTSRNDTVTSLLDNAQELIQTRGFNAFSYRDLADSVGIRTASIHYHFPTKNDLALRLMERYQATLEERLATIQSRSKTARARLKKFVDIYREVFAQDDRICMCGSLASDITTLPPALRTAVELYFETSQYWVQEVITEGVRSGEFKKKTPADDLAGALTAALQGALQFDRVAGKKRLIDLAEKVILGQLTAK